MAAKTRDDNSSPAGSDAEQQGATEKQSVLESRRRFVRNALIAGGVLAASGLPKTGSRPAFAGVITSTTTSTSTSTTTSTSTSTTSTTSTSTTSTSTTSTTSTSTTTTSTTPAPTTTPAPAPAATQAVPVLGLAGAVALGAALVALGSSKLQVIPTGDADNAMDTDESDTK